jgi:uncharacterized protein (TIGR02246 family)
MIRRLAAVTVLALAACAPKPETPEQMAARMKAESDSARPAIQAVGAKWQRYFNAGLADSVAMLYAEDAALMAPNEPLVRGRTAIQAQVLKWLTLHTTSTITTTQVDAYGPIAVEQGTFADALKPGQKAPAGLEASVPDTGKYVTTYKKVNGKWLIFADISNSSRPMPAPAAKKH